MKSFITNLKGFITNPFTKLVVIKAVFYLIVAFVALNLVFFIPRIGGGNPVDLLIPRVAVSPGMNYTAIRDYYMHYFGLDKPLFPDQYINFWRQVLTLDLGRRLGPMWPEPVLEAVLFVLPFTLALVIPVLIISFYLGNWIGAKAAFTGGKWSELAYFASVFANRLPSFWLGLVLVFLLSTQAKLFPTIGPWITPGRIPGWNLDTFLDLLDHYLLPFLSLFIVYLGGWATGMRAMTIHEMDSGYVRYSDQLGFRKSKSMSYAQRNAILPQFTGINLYFNALIGETAVIEIIFGWPGLGKLLYDAVVSYDSATILGCFMVLMIVVIVGNFLVDILYGFVDPRIRIGRG
jgi:peptide/nickel transport system permease protein